MHSLAIALHQKGSIVTGSDDAIFEPCFFCMIRWFRPCVALRAVRCAFVVARVCCERGWKVAWTEHV